MIPMQRPPLVRNRGRDVHYYALSQEEVDELMLITTELVERANAIMARVMKIHQDINPTPDAEAE